MNRREMIGKTTMFGLALMSAMCDKGPTEPESPRTSQPPTNTPVPQPPAKRIVTMTVNYQGNWAKSADVDVTAQPNVLEAIRTLSRKEGFGLDIRPHTDGLYVATVSSFQPIGKTGWQYANGDVVATKTSSLYSLQGGEHIRWFYGMPQSQPY